MGLEGIVCKRRGSAYASGPSTNWLKVKTFMESELDLLGVQRTPGKPTMALMGEIGTRQYVGSAFVTFGRPASDLFKGMVEANLGPPPHFKRNSKEAVQLMNRILKHRQNPQTAADVPRWRVRAGREVVVEPGMGGRLIAALERKGTKSPSNDRTSRSHLAVRRSSCGWTRRDMSPDPTAAKDGWLLRYEDRPPDCRPPSLPLPVVASHRTLKAQRGDEPFDPKRLRDKKAFFVSPVSAAT